jgi:hypothetical protein
VEPGVGHCTGLFGRVYLVANVSMAAHHFQPEGTELIPNGGVTQNIAFRQ